MRVAIARTMPEFSMDVYAEGLIKGLQTVRPDWKMIELSPVPINRKSRSPFVRINKYYERFWNFPRYVSQQEADIVHIIDAAEAHIIYWLQKTSQRTVVTCHDLINYFYPENRIASVQLPIVSHQMWLHAIRGMQQADSIIAVSTATAKDTSAILNIDTNRISVVPDAVESIFQPLPESDKTLFRQQLGIQAETFCLLNVGSDHRRKNILNILKSLAIAKQRGIPLAFWKVGSPFTKEQSQLIQNLHLEDAVRYLGQPDRSTLVQLYNAADVLVAPSFFEGFGMTLLEAMACGTPVITSNISSMPEVIGDNGILVDPNSPQVLAEAIVQLYKDPQIYTSLVKKGLERAKTFTWENTAEKIARIYEKLLVSN